MKYLITLNELFESQITKSKNKHLKKKDFHIYCFNLSAKRKVLEEYIMYLYIMHVGVYEITMYLLN